MGYDEACPGGGGGGAAQRLHAHFGLKSSTLYDLGCFNGKIDNAEALSRSKYNSSMPPRR